MGTNVNTKSSHKGLHAASSNLLVLDLAPSKLLATGRHYICILTMSYTKGFPSVTLKDFPIWCMTPPLSFRTSLSGAKVLKHSN